jgi:1,4-dihydroxy-2-naphthoate polyprenyltransferase
MNDLSETTPQVAPDSLAASSLAAWVLAARPKTLPAAASPVLVGTAIAAYEGQVSILPFLATFVGAALLQIASNFANDVFDHEKGADTESRLGPTRAVQAGLVCARAMKKALVFCLALALLVGVYLTWVSGWPIVVIGLLSMMSAVAYTGGPYPLGYHGLGDLFVMIFFGFVAVCGTVFVQIGHVPPLAFMGGGALGALCTNILVVNNLRDRYTDAVAGKRTLAVRWGRTGALAEYLTLLVAAYIIPISLMLTRSIGPWVLLPLLSLPLAVSTTRGVFRGEGQVLNDFLARTAKVLFVFSALFALGIFLEAGSR